jgi:hypothetical protein
VDLPLLSAIWYAIAAITMVLTMTRNIEMVVLDDQVDLDGIV